MLFSRAIRLRSLKEGEALALVPYADLINHSPFSQAYIDAREGGDWLFSSGEEEVILYADRGYRRMEQVSRTLRLAADIKMFLNNALMSVLLCSSIPCYINCLDLYFLWTQIQCGTVAIVWIRR